MQLFFWLDVAGLAECEISFGWAEAGVLLTDPLMIFALLMRRENAALFSWSVRRVQN